MATRADKLDILDKEISDLREEVHLLRAQKPDVPMWVKNSAIAIIFAIFSQTLTAVWWASELTTNVKSLQMETTKNSEFRRNFPAIEQQLFVKLAEIKADQSYVKDMLDDIKEQMKWVKQVQAEHAALDMNKFKTLNDKIDPQK